MSSFFIGLNIHLILIFIIFVQFGPHFGLILN